MTVNFAYEVDPNSGELMKMCCIDWEARKLGVSNELCERMLRESYPELDIVIMSEVM